jgi:acylphosphatase
MYKNISEDEVIQIAEHSSFKNKKRGITGVLLYVDGSIIQILEGEKEKVLNLYDIIKEDNRHTSIIKIDESNIEKRHFENWSMGFEKIIFKELQQNPTFKSYDISDIIKNIDDKAKTFLNLYFKKELIVFNKKA